MRIEKDTTVRGTKENPVYLVFLKYGSMPCQEYKLDATTDELAFSEVTRKFKIKGYQIVLV